MRSISAISAVLAFVLANECTSMADQFGDEVISKLRNALQQCNSISIKGSVSATYESDVAPDSKAISEKLLLELKQQSSQALLSIKSKTDRPGQPLWIIQKDFILYNNGDVLSCQAQLDSAFQQVKGVTDDLSFQLHSKRVAEQQTLDRKSIYTTLNDAGVILWIVGYAPLIEYIDSASNVTVSPTEGGANLQATSELGRLSLMLSKSQGWLPKSFTVVKDPEHRTHSGLVGSIKMGGGGIWPAGGIKRITWTGSIESFADDNGKPFPKKMVVVQQLASLAGPVVKIHNDVEVEQLVYGPKLTESDFNTNITAPVGFPVGVHGAAHLPYMWDGKRAVPGIPTFTDRDYETLAAANTGGGMKITLIATNVILLLLFIVGVLFWRHRSLHLRGK